MKHIFLLLLAAALLLGCGQSNPTKYEVSGSVSYRGQTLPMGSVMFVPKKGQPCAGDIDENGQYRLRAPAGEYGVQINAIKPPQGGRPDPSVEGGMVYPNGARPTPLLPMRYNNTTSSGLSATVSAENENKIDFTLQ